MGTDNNKQLSEAWRCDLPQLIKEMLENSGNTTNGILQKPCQITYALLAELARTAQVVDDPRINCMMLRLGLYDQAIPGREGFVEAQEYLEACYRPVTGPDVERALGIRDFSRAMLEERGICGTQPATPQLVAAIDHVSETQFKVSQVTFDPGGRWCYQGEGGDAPAFDESVDTGLLEEAADSLECFPAVFFMGGYW